MSKVINAMQDYIFTSKYARWLEDKQRRETWKEAVDRVRNMMLKYYADYNIDDDINWAYDMMQKKRVLGSQRALQFGGDSALKKHARIFNCVSSYADRPRFFQEFFWLLLCGCGAGFSVQKHHVAKLPSISSPAGETLIYTIPDTIEGWADSVGELLNSYFQSTNPVQFDYSKIRPKGSLLSSGVGKAPGPDGLRNAHEKIRELLDNVLKEHGSCHLRPIHVYDICMHIADAVLSGGIRRSATIAIFSPDDIEMATAKTGNWFEKNPQRARSNNSALLLRNKTTKKEFSELMKCVKEFGEPGFVWADSPEHLVNPCVTEDTVIAVENGLNTVNNLMWTNNKYVLVDGKSNKILKGFWQTGFQPILELEFKSGRILKCTPQHLIKTINGWIEAQNLTELDDVIVSNHREFLHKIDTTSKDYAQGYCLGNLVGDGNKCEQYAQMKWWGSDRSIYRHDGLLLLKQAGWYHNRHQKTSNSNSEYDVLHSKELLEFANQKLDNNKELTNYSLNGSWSYNAGLIAGYFDADGTVIFNQNKGSSLRIWSISLSNLRTMQIALNGFGIYSKIYQDRQEAGYRQLPDGQGGVKEYYCSNAHELVISCDNIQQFYKLIPIRHQEKINKIKSIIDSYQRTPNKTNFIDQVCSIKPLPHENVYDCTVDNVSSFDGNGLSIHNCVEISFFAYDIINEDKFNNWKQNHLYDPIIGEPEDIGLKSGWQGCNLTTNNCATLKGSTIEEKTQYLLDNVRASTIIGTLQAGFTNMDYLGKTSENIWKREALLGVSMTGMMDNYEIVLNPEFQQRAAKLCLEVNAEIANKIDINPAARATCLKPEGTGTLILGSTAHGCHAHHYVRYLRAVQANTDENVYKFFKSINPKACEPSVWSANKTDDVIYFPVEVPDGAKTKNQLPAIEMLKIVKSTQQNWVLKGMRKNRCIVSWLTHNVSNTVTIVNDEEWKEVEDFIYDNRKYFCGISLVPGSVDKDYPQAPNCAVYTSRQIVQEYGDAAIWTSGLIELALKAFQNNLWLACSTLLKNNYNPKDDDDIDLLTEYGLYTAANRIHFYERARNFADKYFNGDIKRLTYCMKDVFNWKRYCDLVESFTVVDYTKLQETQDNTELEQEIACAGGMCTI